MKKAPKPKSKHRLARFNGWTCKKQGWPTGFGLSAGLAYQDACARIARMHSLRAWPEQLKSVIAGLEKENADLRRRHDAGAFAQVKDKDDADGWVLMAMVITKTDSPNEALGKMQMLHNAELTAREFEAATRVAGYLASWKKRLGA